MNKIQDHNVKIDADALRILKEIQDSLKYKASYSSIIRTLKQDHEKVNQKYNGWVNYETWLVNLWLGNDSSSYEYWREAAQEAIKNAKDDKTFSKIERATLDLMERLKDEIEEANPIQDASMYSDLMNSAISEVNYHEIAEHMINDIGE